VQQVVHLGPGAATVVQAALQLLTTTSSDDLTTRAFHAPAAGIWWNGEYRPAGSRCVLGADAPLGPLLSPAMVGKPPHTGAEQGFHAKTVPSAGPQSTAERRPSHSEVATRAFVNFRCACRGVIRGNLRS
jgi:hypothetical protein